MYYRGTCTTDLISDLLITDKIANTTGIVLPQVNNSCTCTLLKIIQELLSVENPSPIRPVAWWQVSEGTRGSCTSCSPTVSPTKTPQSNAGTAIGTCSRSQALPVSWPTIAMGGVDRGDQRGPAQTVLPGQMQNQKSLLVHFLVSFQQLHCDAYIFHKKFFPVADMSTTEATIQTFCVRHVTTMYKTIACKGSLLSHQIRAPAKPGTTNKNSVVNQTTE